MRETIKSRLSRFAFNLFPCYRRTGASITYVSPDMHEVHIKLPLNWKTRGYNGTIFGGSLYSCIDPVYMVMISWHLGREYIAWDKAATIDFRKAARSTLYSKFTLKPGELDAIRADLQTAERTERVYDVELADRGGTVHAAFKKTIIIRKRKPK